MNELNKKFSTRIINKMKKMKMNKQKYICKQLKILYIYIYSVQYQFMQLFKTTTIIIINNNQTKIEREIHAMKMKNNSDFEGNKFKLKTIMNG